MCYVPVLRAACYVPVLRAACDVPVLRPTCDVPCKVLCVSVVAGLQPREDCREVIGVAPNAGLEELGVDADDLRAGG
jgi:hypothetical protein